MSINKLNFTTYVFFILIVCSSDAWFFRYQPSNAPTQDMAQAPILAKTINILLVPAGDAHNKGRSLIHQFESSCMMALAQEAKEAIENRHNAVRVLISHSPSDILQPWHSATMANTLDIDLVLSLHCYHEQGPKPVVAIYTFSYGQDFVNKLIELSWQRAHNAYLFSSHTTQAWSSLLIKELQKPSFTTLYTVTGPFKIPFTPLIGIKVPAIGIEMSLKDDDAYKNFIEPLAQSLDPIIDPLIKQATIQVIS